MKVILSTKDLEYLRSLFKKGTRIVLTEMSESQAPPVGTKGTVQFVDDIGNIHVNWDDGSTLALVFGEDSCSLVS